VRVREHWLWEVARAVLFWGAAAIVLFVCFDAMMRQDQLQLCERDQVECPE